ncbi:polysaccharide deacetylase family protein [Deinococcus multiflagellatus]|uniref:polysaccharide deacetylase family protein n=1 Tax=Deinococcus multiflagellatus TaxID=1656887 RepID=UPI0029620F4D|nr:polysaccharide deacetylase family protein [Deinococcus multiflagellatus]
MRRTLAWGGALLLGYIGLPYLLVQRLNLGVLREGPPRPGQLALTFDDGPDPQTTPAVLDALKAAGMHATFFVLAPHAEAHPALVRRLLAEGHEVQAHAARHLHAWVRSPWSAFLDPGEAARRIAAVTGQPVTLHRPPHGAYTLATILGQRTAGLRGAHWSVEGGDWQKGATPQGTVQALLPRLRPGAVVVLHDAGPGARVTVPMLPDLLRAMQQRGLRSVTLKELATHP